MNTEWIKFLIVKMLLKREEREGKRSPKGNQDVREALSWSCVFGMHEISSFQIKGKKQKREKQNMRFNNKETMN